MNDSKDHKAAAEPSLDCNVVHSKPECWMTHDQNGNPMFWGDRKEAVLYCDTDEYPIPLYVAGAKPRICQCGMPWEPDMDQFGCWSCGTEKPVHNIEVTSRQRTEQRIEHERTTRHKRSRLRQV